AKVSQKLVLAPGARPNEAFHLGLEAVHRQAGHVRSLDSHGMDRTPTSQRLSSRERVLAALAAYGLEDVSVREFSESTATAVDAAAAIGTTVERIVKSLIFAANERPILVLASGPNRVDLH